MKDYFTDERMWATHRRSWRLKQWWNDRKYLLLAALIIILYLLVSYYEERDKRMASEARAYYMALHLSAASCYTQESPTSFLIVGDSQRTLYKGLLNVARQADDIRAGWIIAQSEVQNARKP